VSQGKSHGIGKVVCDQVLWRQVAEHAGPVASDGLESAVDRGDASEVEQADRDVSAGGHDPRSAAAVAGAGIFAVFGIADPVDRFDTPLAAGDLRQVRGPGAVLVQAGDGVHDLLREQGTGGVVAVAADPDGPGDVREVQASSVGDPQGPSDDPAVAVVDLDEVRLARAAGLDGVVDGALQAALVSLDEQEVVRVPAAVLSGPAM
jgi:hypothetical protein